MAGGGNTACKRDQPSIKCRLIPLDVESLDLRLQGDVSTRADSDKQKQLLTTAQLVSALGKVWESANRPIPIFQPKENIHHGTSFHLNENVLHYIGRERNKASAFNYQDSGIHPKCAKLYYDMVTSSFECTETTSMKFLSGVGNSSIFSRYVQFDDPADFVESWKGNMLSGLGASVNFGKLCERINRRSSLESRYPTHISQIECQRSEEIKSETAPAHNVVVDCPNPYNDVTKREDAPCISTVESTPSIEKSITHLDYDNSLKPVTNTQEAEVVSDNQSSEHHKNVRDSDSCAVGEGDDTLQNKSMLKKEEHVLKDVHTKDLCSVTKEKPKDALPNQRHALAGALSGTFVSLCLHPVDTIKTVIQSASTAEKSILCVFRSIIADRGVTGLYSGIASNIASSAPISAVYTYTYESVKGALLPLLPKEYYSIAHCTAGGCASIATSFIFTPSERIKQQMQVGSNYRNCWAALIAILGRGGFSSLYAGWGAVLCRNIPHSIIKFYTYETLKQLLSSSTQSNARPSTYQTLICGGFAGSTAALFTTPFDVVKTRLQTQRPGSLSKYDGVFHALQEISKHEGLKGLYRGLTPRLIMYISQGSLFFASYETFKSIFTVESLVIQNKQNIEDDCTS